MTTAQLLLTLRTCKLELNEQGQRTWVQYAISRSVKAAKTAMLISDMWDRHWSDGVNWRTALLAPQINAVAELLRAAGVLIVHAPSETMESYRSSPARVRLLYAHHCKPAIRRSVVEVPLPIDDSDGGSDTAEPVPVNAKVWSRQHALIRIDDTQDLIAGDEGELIYSALKERSIDTLLYSGVHANMCLLNRSFGIKQMLAWGINCVLFEDLSDVIYNPARVPYVNHEEAHKLVIRFIEKFYCPTTLGAELDL